jgi:hypothetical protein
MPLNPPRRYTPRERASSTVARVMADRGTVFALGLVLGLLLGRI